MDLQILLFHRQYLQLFDPTFLAWPPKQLLKDIDVQLWLHAHCFDDTMTPRLPPPRYQLRVLKTLISKIEQSLDNPDEDEISDALVSQLAGLMAAGLPSETTAAQQKTYVTFSCPRPGNDVNNADTTFERTITLLERPYLISGSLTTGFRTWEASMHLGTYLLTPVMAELVRGSNVFELGVGTGFVSILCANVLGAKHVTATDGDEGVVEAFKENLFLNDLDDGSKVTSSTLRWGRGFRGTWVEDDCEAHPYDVVVGADITYDKHSLSALVATLRFLFDLRPSVEVIIAGAVRNAQTFETFRQACLRTQFHVAEADFPSKPMREQKTMFYAAAVPFRILRIQSSLRSP